MSRDSAAVETLSRSSRGDVAQHSAAPMSSESRPSRGVRSARFQHAPAVSVCSTTSTHRHSTVRSRSNSPCPVGPSHHARTVSVCDQHESSGCGGQSSTTSSRVSPTLKLPRSARSLRADGSVGACGGTVLPCSRDVLSAVTVPTRRLSRLDAVDLTSPPPPPPPPRSARKRSLPRIIAPLATAQHAQPVRALDRHCTVPCHEGSDSVAPNNPASTCTDNVVNGSVKPSHSALERSLATSGDSSLKTLHSAVPMSLEGRADETTQRHAVSCSTSINAKTDQQHSVAVEHHCAGSAHVSRTVVVKPRCGQCARRLKIASTYVVSCCVLVLL